MSRDIDFDPDSPSEPLSRSTVRVVVADPQTVARCGTCHLLGDTPGISVRAAASTRAEALQLACTHRPDVLVTEATFPDGLGTEIPKPLRAEGVQTRVLIFSAYRRTAYLESFLEHGAAGYLLKRDEYSLLVDAVQGIQREELGWYSRSIASRLLSLRHNRPSEGSDLTSREYELLEILAQGLANRKIADKLGLSVGTVKNYLTRIYEKLDVKGRAEAIVWAYQNELVA